MNLKHDQFEIIAETIWPSRFRFGWTRLVLLFAISMFLRKLSTWASNLQAYNPSPFQHIYSNSLQASQLQSTRASTVTGLQLMLFSKPNAVFAAKHFIFSISVPSSWNWERMKTILQQMIRRRRDNVLWYLAYFSSPCVKKSTINSH